ncbi:uncharacterized protein LOC131288854 [Anopheles ziemanni]|uniref:uncharacterized protein LOC131271665 n=1 Tax=Anopheles coustani TaxID=139045 RepID=UPI002657CE09|nr:uncharacterized protein LOC131271665 [Anopheles coustani]XP_058174017.1 uncharacterized protein LOC131288854 [Anopheles ziemanni]
MASGTGEGDREKASEMISVKLLNQFHTRSFKADDQQGSSETSSPDGRSPPTGPNYETVNLPDQSEPVIRGEPPQLRPSPIEPDLIDVKENVIEDDFLPIAPRVEKRLRDDARVPEKTTPLPAIKRSSPVGNRSTSTTLTTTTTRTTTSMTTIRKVRRRKTIVMSSKPARTDTTTPRSLPTTSLATTMTPKLIVPTSRKPPPLPRIDITKLNLEHLENELVSFPNLSAHPQALQASSPSRLLPRSIRPQRNIAPQEAAPSCGCQHRKRSLAPQHYSSSEENADYDEYDDYDYNDVRRSAIPYGKLADAGPMLFPAMSRLLAPGSSEPATEGSVERAEKVHGTLERLMGIVTIFSHVDEFIQRKTKQSIRRLARLYESEELY